MDERAWWAAALGVVAALVLIGASIAMLTRSVLPFDGWSTPPQPAPVTQTLPSDDGQAARDGQLARLDVDQAASDAGEQRAGLAAVRRQAP